jgi:NarL family two-component system response regulator LiaR
MSTSIPIRVMIVDEHDMVRRGLATVMRLHADLDLVGEAQNGEQAVKLVEQLQPDVVLMDLMMPVMDGATATRIICERWPQVHVIALSASQEQELIQKVLQAGAIGYLLKNLSIDELAEAIRSAHAGQSTLSPEAAQVLNQLNTEQPKPSANA